MIKRCKFIVALALCLCVFAYDTVNISSDWGGRSIAWAEGEGEQQDTGTTPTFSGNALVLSGQLGLYFYMSNVATDYYGTMSFNIANGTVTPSEIKYEKAEDATANGQVESRNSEIGFRCDVNAIQMADEITATYTYTKDGTNTTVENNGTDAIKSVSAYLTKLVATSPYSGYTNLKNLVNAIRDYGYYAQVTLGETNKTDYGTHTPMTANNASIGKTITDDLSTYAFDNQTDATVYYTLDLDSKTALTVYLPKTLDGASTATSTVARKDEDDSVGGKITKKNTYKEAVNTNVTPTLDGDYYALSFKDISAHELDNKYEITVVGKKITVYPLSYVKTILDANTTYQQAGVDNDTQLTHLRQAVVALYNYYNATVAYRADPTKTGE